MNSMLMENYIREQIKNGQYGVIIIPISIAEDIACYIENHRERSEAVRHGKWIKQDDDDGSNIYGWECSVCGEGVAWQTDDDINIEKFCYNCGAKMDLDEVNDD